MNYYPAIILFLILNFKSGYGIIPEDLEPRKIILNPENEKHAIFLGGSTNLRRFNKISDVQEIKMLDHEHVLISARDHFYVVDVSALTSPNQENEIYYNQKVQWLSNVNKTKLCQKKSPDLNDCRNYIRVVWKLSNDSDRVLLCGTNAMEPHCRIYQWTGSQFTGYNALDTKLSEILSPPDGNTEITYSYSDGNIYTGTKLSFRKHPVILRASLFGETNRLDDFMPDLRSTGIGMVEKHEPMPFLKTDHNELDVFSKPTFVGSVDVGDKILFFFREVASEQYGIDNLVYSRVAQVCKNDRGGNKDFRSQKWTSFFKARLNCSIPGARPFYFNEIQHISNAMEIDGEKVVFATMTTPENSIPGSAICAFSLTSINQALFGDFFKRSYQDGNTLCFSEHGQQAPHMPNHPAVCPGVNQDTRDLDINNLEFRRKNVLVKSVVQPVNNIPLFLQTQSRHSINVIAVDDEAARASKYKNTTFIYLGTSNGHLLKIITTLNSSAKETVLSEDMKVYMPEKCGLSNDTESNDANRVLKIVPIPGQNSILVAFKDCVISVPKHECGNYTCKRNCVQSGNPYCGWHKGECVATIGLDKNLFQQDLFAEKKIEDFCGDNNKPTYELVAECRGNSIIPVVVPVAVCAFFLVVIMIFLVIYKMKKNPRIRRDKNLNGNNNILNNSYKRGASFTVEPASANMLNRDYSNRRIYTGPKNDLKRPSNASSISRNQSIRSQAPQVPPPLPPSYENSPKSQNIMKEASYESLKSTAEIKTPESPNNRGRTGSHSSHTSTGSSSRRFHGVNIVHNVKTSPPPRNGAKEKSSNINNNNKTIPRKIIGVATAMSRNESPVRRRCRSTPDDDARDLLLTPGGSKCVRNNSLSSSSTQNNKDNGIIPTQTSSILNHGGPPMVTSYNPVQNDKNRTFKRLSSTLPDDPDYENVPAFKESPNENKAPKPPPVSAKPDRKLSSFSNAHFNTSWFPATVADDHNIKNINENSNEGSSGFGSASTSSRSSLDKTSSENHDHVRKFSEPVVNSSRLIKGDAILNKNSSLKTYTDMRRTMAPPNHLRIDQSQHCQPAVENVNDTAFDSCYINQSNDNAIPIQYDEDSAFFDGKHDSSEDDIMKDLEEIMQRGGCRKQSTKKRKKSKKSAKQSYSVDSSSPSDSEMCPYYGAVESIHSNSGLPVVISDEEHIYEIPKFDLATSEKPKQSTDDFNIGKSNQNSYMSEVNGATSYAFHTMRPKGRRRQKLPRLRNAEKSEEKPLAVPTPTIPL